MKHTIYIVVFFLISCANIIPPTGGPKDTKPPQLLEIIPKNKKKHFNQSNVTFAFDELIQINDKKNIVFSPYSKDAINLVVNKNKLVIDFEKDLIANTTYYLNLDKVIKDVNEGNIIKNLEYLFSTGNTIDTLANCKNMTGDTTSCDAATKRGWYINLDGASKVTAEPTLARGVAYYPIFKPVRNNTECGSGVAYVCGIEAECGKNLSSELDPTNAGSYGNRDCYKVGTGVLSKVVVFNNNLYANISDKSNYATKTDIVVIEAIQRSIIDFRNSWRENF